jgi:ABC-type metal ion transport system, periplasmic component/surface adhesin
MSRFATSALALIAILSVACSGTSPSAAPSGASVSVVTTTTVFADLVGNVGGDHVTVRSLVPNGGDVHTFDPKPSDAVALSNADVVFMNGLGLDDWLTDLAQSAGQAQLTIIKLGENLTDVQYIANDPNESAGGAQPNNPHLWMDVLYARKYVDRIRAELDQIDPAHASDYDANATTYDGTLVALDQYVRTQFDAIPQAQRKLVAFHDAFPYYAREYGLTIVGVVVAAPGQDPSAGQIADLISAIRAANVKLILSEVQFPDTLVRQIASETVARVEADLADDALTDTVTSYEQLIRTDTDKIVEGLR